MPTIPAPFTPEFIPASNAAFMPDIFSKKLQMKFYAGSILPNITNTDYEGDISGPGSKVIIRKVPSVAVADYTGTVSYAELVGDTLELEIDKAKSYAFKVDDVMKSPADIQYWNEASKDAAESMRIAVETDVLANIPGGSTLTDVVNAAVTKDNILADILLAARRLDENNIPDTDRFIVLPPWAIQLLKQSDLKFAYLTGDGQSPLRSGLVGRIDRFDVYMSNLLAVSGSTNCLAAHKKFATFASKFVKTETIRLESTFGDGIRGLKVYGYKVVHPTAGVQMTLTPA